MGYLIGIDLGTSGTKTVWFDTEGNIVASALVEYPMYQPHNGWAEQDPADWRRAAFETLKTVTSEVDASKIRGIGISGQMHGLVMVDQDIRPIGNAIIWADQRTGEQISHIYETVPEEEFGRVFENRLRAGFLLPSLVWGREKQPQSYEKIYKVMLPKDYIRYKICGELGTDASDASSTGMWDMKNRTWAYGILEKLGIPKDLLVESHESYENAGKATEEGAGLTGLKKGTFVAYGGGDSLMMELGNGMIRGGLMASTIGTACHLTSALDAPLFDPKLRTNTWCHGG